MTPAARSDRMAGLIAQRREETPEVPLDGMEIFARARELTRLSRRWIEPVFERHGIDSGEFDVLASLQRAGAPYSMRPTELFRTLVMTSGGLTDRLNRLTKKGLVERLPSESDRRSLLVRLSPQGLEVIRAAYREDMGVEQELLSGLSAAERDRLADLLARLSAALEARQAAEEEAGAAATPDGQPIR